MAIDIFDKEVCVHCELPCGIGSGRYVNRYPSYGDDVEGWVCGDCEFEFNKENEDE